MSTVRGKQFTQSRARSQQAFPQATEIGIAYLLVFVGAAICTNRNIQDIPGISIHYWTPYGAHHRDNEGLIQH